MTRWILLCGLAWGLLLSGRESGQGAEPKNDNAALLAAKALYDGIKLETLPNGLKVYMKPIPGAATVTTMMAYRVGSCDEDLDATGLSHYLEHLLFKGTDKLMPGDIDRLTLRNGGANNAYTSEDYTIYYFDFASDRWEVALEIEADRMWYTRIDAKHEFELEKNVVIEELQRNEDTPWDLETKQILPMLFGKTAPYGHPVIGERAHVKGATAKVITEYYNKWYHPNNASLVICGGFDPDKAIEKVKTLFGKLKAVKLPERKKLPDEKLKRPARHEMESKFEVPRLLMGFNTVRTNDPDAPALEVLGSILAGGKTSRLYQKLVLAEQLASETSATSSPGRYPGWFALEVEVLPGKDREKTEKQVLDELVRLQKEPVSAAELKRVQETLLTEAVFAREGVHGLADNIARGVTTDDLEHLKNYLPNVLAVTAADIQRVAKKYLDPEQRVVVWSVPPKKRSAAPALGAPGGSKNDSKPARKQELYRTALKAEAAQASASSTQDWSFKQAKRVELPNGLVLLMYENRRLPILVANAAVRRVQMHEPEAKAGVATLTGFLLDEGTTKHTGKQIAELIEDVGGTLTMGSSGGTVRVLSKHRSLGLSLLFECLTQPSFPKDAFSRQKTRMLAQLDEAELVPEHKAQNTFAELIYGTHPMGRPSAGRRKTVEPLTTEDCSAFHNKVFVPNNTTLVLVGDFDSEAITEEIKKLTADWKKTELAKPTYPEIIMPKEFTQKIVTMPHAVQLHFYMGHPGITRTNPDYFKLQVLDYVLGTGPGFTDRLSARLRDREGLAYTVSANITSSAGEEAGTFTCYIGTDVKNFERVKAGFLEELNRIRDTKPTKAEVDDVKSYLLGNLPFQISTNARIASQLLTMERYGLGFDYLEKYRKAIEAVTPDDVQEMAKKYIDPKRMILVASGPIDIKGKPISPGK